MVAEVFGKKHKHVLEAIDELVKGVAEKSADLFYEDTYTHPQLLLAQLLKRFEVREEVVAALKTSQTIESYTQKETAALLKISEPTLIERRKKGEIRAYESGRNVMYTAAEINRYRENNKI